MIKLFILTVLIGVATSLPAIDTEERQDVPGYCRYGDRYIKEGQQGPGPLGECRRLTCASAEPGRQTILGVGCGTFIPRAGCTLSKTDYTKLYPDCCPDEICPSSMKYAVELDNFL